ncbi:hypothetical protein [Chitinimonas sp. BJB300]|uniref:hypothetical protein n=1 Tax=Chitinimonas sp. BJB300 TaxID=1559339 RepID=UPI000C0DAF5C|nr:hypothetical protein [Chitinimonas sp. BJB300]PHV12307.1 hypothetical protein CSQ89_06525 [Chitinimonas sp. BJB300]TSJ88168.1 hypothetical protein FG002_011675 [Chitinimonas sp. BJB300]
MKPAWKAGLTVAGLAGLLALSYTLRPTETSPTTRYQCTDLTKPCAIQIGGQPFLLRAQSAPSMLKPFHLVLRGPTRPAARVRFGMQGMEMGAIAFPLSAQADGSLATNIVLPYCVQGRRDWWLRLELPEESIEVAFVTL